MLDGPASADPSRGAVALEVSAPMVRHRPIDGYAARDDQIIGLVADCTSYSEIARRVGLGGATAAKLAYHAARGRQIPVEHVPRTHPKPPEAVIAWAAGFFDGEGCIFGYEGTAKGWRRFTFGLTTSQAVREPLDLLLAHWGGAISFFVRRQVHHKDQWRWQIRGADAAVFLSDILPHLRVKRRAAEAAIPCLFRVHRHWQPFAAAEVEQRRQAIAILRDGNHRGRVSDG